MRKLGSLHLRRRDSWRLTAFSMLAVAGLVASNVDASDQEPAVSRSIQVYKSPTCGCCEQWISHLEANGFEVVAKDLPDVSVVKRQNGLPPSLASCHTAIVGGYVVEGHVPAADIERLLREKPKIVGLAVPGMPIGSPGMEGPKPEAYDVIAFDGQGHQQVYASHAP